MKRIGQKIKWMIFWGFILCMIFGQFIGYHQLGHDLGKAASDAGSLLSPVWDATVGRLLGQHGVSVH